ncbi:MAG: phosphoenolpyruvate--protein phosphotransferase [Lachnospiraceae bacterium]|nr:phosphoenolpyruvate--protein phosphotransferase [Lachnospiraceae bacterium]
MVTIKGKSISPGIAIGTIQKISKASSSVARTTVTDPEAEVKRFEAALAEAEAQLAALYKKAQKEVGESEAAIFEVHGMLLKDPDLTEKVKDVIRTQQVVSEFALSSVKTSILERFSSMEDAYMRERTADIQDIICRLMDILTGSGKDQILDRPMILMAEELTPSNTLQIERKNLLALITRFGSSNSHASILARIMNIPAIANVDIDDDWNGKTAILDGYTDTLIIEPTKQVLSQMKARQKEEENDRRTLQAFKGIESITSDGHKINLFANIGSTEDVGSALENDAEGIGLFRSEFLFLNRSTPPSEEEQFQAYKTVAENMEGKKVIIRTLDLGADKQANYLQLDKEENPAMGFRAIRISLSRPELFKTQLRAIYRSSAFGNIALMFPMIISVDEVKRIKEILSEVKADLDKQGISYKDIEIGIMVETPAAVILSRELAEEVDFLSIGSNDLTQYALAMDRQNPYLDAFYDPHHPAVLKMIELVVQNAHKVGCQVGICGELAADLSLTETFLRMGIDELSVAPVGILGLRKKIRETSLNYD